MKRSAAVPLTLVSTLAMMACAAEETRCVDSQNRVVADSLCGPRGRGAIVSTPGGVWPYHYYYGGAYYNGFVSGGSLTPSSSGIFRGGFGSIGTGSGAHAGE